MVDFMKTPPLSKTSTQKAGLYFDIPRLTHNLA
jgi:hypothetical protein